MKGPVILHIPHASTLIPEEYRSGYTADVGRELAVMTDWYTDELFDCDADRLVFPVSRLVCDAERFRDDRREVMAKIGMGAVYTACHDLRSLRTVTPAQREAILRRWYDPHHAALEEMTRERVERFGACTIVDCHSFYPKALPYERDRTKDRPDVCIGTDPFHTPPELAERLAWGFRQAGCRVAFNAPFAGALVPFGRYGKDRRVRAVMIEVNRGLYLNERGKKTAGFERLRSLLRRLIPQACREADRYCLWYRPCDIQSVLERAEGERRI